MRGEDRESGALFSYVSCALIVDAALTHATGTAERDAALLMLDRRKRRRRVTLGADKAYDVGGFVDALRSRKVTPHIAVRRLSDKDQQAAQDQGRRPDHPHPGYVVSQRIRKRIEESFGWIKTAGGLAKTRHRGLERAGWMFALTAAACNLVRLPRLLAEVAP